MASRDLVLVSTFSKFVQCGVACDVRSPPLFFTFPSVDAPLTPPNKSSPQPTQHRSGELDSLTHGNDLLTRKSPTCSSLSNEKQTRHEGLLPRTRSTEHTRLRREAWGSS